MIQGQALLAGLAGGTAVSRGSGREKEGASPSIALALGMGLVGIEADLAGAKAGSTCFLTGGSAEAKGSAWRAWMGAEGVGDCAAGG